MNDLLAAFGGMQVVATSLTTPPQQAPSTSSQATPVTSVALEALQLGPVLQGTEQAQAPTPARKRLHEDSSSLGSTTEDPMDIDSRLARRRTESTLSGWIAKVSSMPCVTSLRIFH